MNCIASTLVHASMVQIIRHFENSLCDMVSRQVLIERKITKKKFTNSIFIFIFIKKYRKWKNQQLIFAIDKGIPKPGNIQYLVGSGWQGSRNIPVHGNTVLLKYK